MAKTSLLENLSFIEYHKHHIFIIYNSVILVIGVLTVVVTLLSKKALKK